MIRSFPTLRSDRPAHRGVAPRNATRRQAAAVSLFAVFPLVDGGVPASAKVAGLGERFHYWLGRSGRRYLFTAVERAALLDFGDAVIVVAARDGESWSGRAVGILGDPGFDPLSLAAAEAAGMGMFVHLLSPTAAGRRAVLDDLLGRARDEGLAA